MAVYPRRIEFDLTIRQFGIKDKKTSMVDPMSNAGHDLELIEEHTHNGISLTELFEKLLSYIRD